MQWKLNWIKINTLQNRMICFVYQLQYVNNSQRNKQTNKLTSVRGRTNERMSANAVRWVCNAWIGSKLKLTIVLEETPRDGFPGINCAFRLFDRNDARIMQMLWRKDDLTSSFSLGFTAENLNLAELRKRWNELKKQNFHFVPSNSAKVRGQLVFLSQIYVIPASFTTWNMTWILSSEKLRLRWQREKM